MKKIPVDFVKRGVRLARKYFLVIAVLIACTSTLFARFFLWPNKEKPPVSLVDAVDVATKELNKDGADFYCLSARVFSSRSNCDWSLGFSSKDGEERFVTVTGDKEVFISKEPTLAY